MKFIGLRNIKTAIAVFITLMFKLILILLIGEEQAFIWYTPFFAGIAAAYSMQKDVKSSLRQAKIRSMGSIIGGIYGILLVLLVEQALIPAFGAGFASNNLAVLSLSYLIYSVALIGVIIIAIKTRQTPAVFITCLTYLSVTVSIRNGGQPVVMFGINRIISTIFGVFVAVGVNLFHLPQRNKQNILFVSGLDNTILNDSNELSGFTQYKINSLLHQGAKISFATTRSPSSVNRLFDGLNLSLPVVIMNGAALYDSKQSTYSHIQTIPKEISNLIDRYLLENKIGAFTHTITNDSMIIYINNIDNEAEMNFYNKNKNKFFNNYVKSTISADELVSYYVVIDLKDDILKYQDALAELCGDEIIINTFPYNEMEGYYYLKISDNDANKLDALNYLGQITNIEKTVVFGGEMFDIPMLNAADISICLSDAPEEVKNACDYVLNKNNPDLIVKTIERIYHGKKIITKE